MPDGATGNGDSSHLALLKRFAALGWLENATVLPTHQGGRWWRRRNIVAAITGQLNLGERVLSLKVGLSGSFPLNLPEIAFDSAQQLPHVDSDGKLCYEPDEGLLMDRDNPWAVLLEGFALARAALERLFSGNQAEEFVQEIAAYWVRLCNGQKYKLQCVVDPTHEPHRITALLLHTVLAGVADSPEMFRQSTSRRNIEGLTHQKAVYIPIVSFQDKTFTPQDLLSLEKLRGYVWRGSNSCNEALRELLRKLHKREEFVVLGVERPVGERVLIGLKFVGVQGIHPLLEGGRASQIVPIAMARADRPYLAPRGGARTELSEKRVLLVGCGAVGGHIALSLARAGVGALTLVDPDSFEMNNAFRHTCGMSQNNEPKVGGIKLEIERQIPFVQVSAQSERIETLLIDQPKFLNDFDLVICATGAPTVELELNARVWASPLGPPIMFAWLEPLGLGGHVLLTQPSSGTGTSRGCFQCLHVRQHVGGPLRNRAAFADPGHVYSRDDMGCGGRHVSFSDLDAQQTALMATRLAVDTLSGHVQGSPLFSWKGTPEVFRAAGHVTTPRFEASQRELDEESFRYVRKECPVCSR